jgi:CRISPR-associated endonuclease/helicase Cas3
MIGGAMQGTLPGFGEYFRALWDREPFPWQSMLAERVAAGDWPQAIDLPTASGKTACIDIAVYALAAQAHRPVAERRAPRRIWFVVDRRIVVDEAFQRAKELAERLAGARTGPLQEVGDRLRALSGTDRPLAVGRLRGGVLRDDGWARIPSQTAVITSTVDQLGSRLLFRGYGPSLLAAPIFAGLAANDSLILLDEAHCAVPFMQTLRAIQRYRGSTWAEDPLPSPFGFVVMSATPPQGMSSSAVFPGEERESALADPDLQRRLRTSKLAQLVAIERSRGTEADQLVKEAVRRTVGFVQNGGRRVAVMVNRVRTAMELATELRNALGDEAEVILLTGRIRPLERDGLIEHWGRYLRADNPQELATPIIVVTTQCLEVGADFSFDALITECASLDALRQRFGRLARLGSDQPAPAAILARQPDIEAREADPIYGTALAETWKWLQRQAIPDEHGHLVVDMGVEALERRVREVEDLPSLLAPSPDAPVLLPAHLDLLCQTAPPAYPEPDVALYLHGRPGPPDVSVVWRSDLREDDTQQWLEIVAMCPPVSGEMLQVPLWRVRMWLADEAATDDSADVEGLGNQREGARERTRPCVVWRGRDRSRVVTTKSDIRGGDVLVVPAWYGIGPLGQATAAQAVGREGLDLWETARVAAGQPAAVRLSESVLAPWLDCPPLQELVTLAASPAPDREVIQDAIRAVLEYRPEEDSPPPPPKWWTDLLAQARGGRMVEHPAGGLILVARARRRLGAESDLFADDDDLASAADREVSLENHSQLVRRAAQKIADRCLPASLSGALALAGLWHDAGKLDPRFQVLLRQGDEVGAATAAEAIAKSAFVPTSPARRRAIREASGLPRDFRHEMLSLELARRFAELPPDDASADLVLHLITSHHGHGRPFAPVAVDRSLPDVSGSLAGTEIRLTFQDRASSPPAYRVDSGVAERFWRLTRRYGWWGLAYLEALLRLADWYASNFSGLEGGDA